MNMLLSSQTLLLEFLVNACLACGGSSQFSSGNIILLTMDVIRLKKVLRRVCHNHIYPTDCCRLKHVATSIFRGRMPFVSKVIFVFVFTIEQVFYFQLFWSTSVYMLASFVCFYNLLI